MVRTLVISDLHSMHRAGLVHPEFDARPQNRESPQFSLYRLRSKMFKFYSELIDFLKPVDVLIVNGDAVEGKGGKSGSTEVLTADRAEQASNAAALINMVGARVVEMTYGSAYHAGVSEDWEDETAKEVENLHKVESVGYYKIGKLMFQARHHVGRSSVPYGRMTPLAKQNVWNVLWKERGEYPHVDIILRSHVHYFTYCGEADWLAFTTPALQAYWTKYGTRRCDGTVDFGLLWFDVDGSSMTWDHRLLRLRRPGEAVSDVNRLLQSLQT